MTVIATHLLEPGKAHPDDDQIYNGLDCAVTFEVWEALQHIFNETPAIYNFERALQAPALEMMLRGFRIDRVERDRAIEKLTVQLTRLEYILNRVARAVWDKDLNARSRQQLMAFFYGPMKLKPIETSIKGKREARMDRETLEKLELYFYARPIVALVLAIREIGKKIGVLRSEVDPDGRMRTSINVGATETGRFSASKSTTGTGTNFFNIQEELRVMFVADPGWKLAGIDLEQAESREVGRICGVLFDDWSYLDACESGDLHTTVAKMVWPSLAWPGDAKGDRALADQLFYRHYSYRYMAKRGGHGTNYLLTPWTASRQLKCPLDLMQSFQERYMLAFPCIPNWHRWVAEQIQTIQQLGTCFGRQRHFFGRPNDDTTLREAVAYEPQSSTADRLNIGLLRIWEHFGNRVQVLLQLYDAIYFQYREDDNEAEILSEALALIDVPIEAKGRTFTVPGEAKIGWNWASYVGPEDVARAIAQGNKPPDLNLDGLKKYKGEDLRKRTALLDRVM